MTRLLRGALSLLFISLCRPCASAQISIQGDSSTDDHATGASAAQAQYPSSVTLEFNMTPQEAAHLLASVDEVIAFDSKFTGLPVHGHVNRKITSRDELRALSAQRVKDPDTDEKLQRSTAVLQKFGFVPRDFDVEKFAIESTVSQLAGY